MLDENSMPIPSWRPTFPKEFPQTKQELFDICASHLLRQGFKCQIPNPSPYGEFMCGYRKYNERGEVIAACGFGAAIPQEKYIPKMENVTAKNLLDSSGDFKDLAILFNIKDREFMQLADDIQWIHDSNDVSEWRRGLSNLVSKFGLDDKVLNDPANVSQYGSL